MKFTHWLILFLALFFVAFILFEVVTKETTTSSVTNNEYSEALATAVHDAAKTIKVENYSMDQGVWRTEDDRRHTLDVFYSDLTLSFGHNLELGIDFLKQKVPFVMLVDIDGFYISYNAALDKYGNSVLTPGYSEFDVLTDINTWSEAYGAKSIRFYLTDYVDVTLANNMVYSGRRKAVAATLSAEGALTSDIAFLADENNFKDEKNKVILTRCEDTINYLINTQMINVNPNMTGYNVSLAKGPGEYWQRMIENPTVVAFIQGNQKYLQGNVLNEYAFAAGEISASKLYFIENGYYYPLDDEDVVKTSSMVTTLGGETVETTVYTHNGIPITEIYGSMEECAAKGAMPKLK